MCIFAPVPRPFRAFVRSLSLLLHLRPLLAQPLPVLSATFPSALNFKFRATTVSAAAATTDFRVFPPAYVLSFVSVEAGYYNTPRIRGHARSTARRYLVTPHFYLWRHPVCIRIDSVIYFAADTRTLLPPFSRVCRGGGRGKGEFRKPLDFDPSPFFPPFLPFPLSTLSLSFASTLRATERLLCNFASTVTTAQSIRPSVRVLVSQHSRNTSTRITAHA